MTLRLKNSLSGQVEEFQPLEDRKVGMYVCGPTVYDYFHIGNARPFVAFDVVRRWLIHSGYEVTFVQNVTDIDDKIINRARDEGTTSDHIATTYTDAYFEDVGKLGVMEPDHSPRATQTIDGIIALVQELEKRGLAYQTADGVYYRVEKFEGYGKLSGKDLEHLRQGASDRTDQAMTEAKEKPWDFALWKAQKAPDEPAWDSPWGKGRPGWHIECSAMSRSLLGDSFDIHAGGEDLQFPHHENEIAQSEGATGKPFAKYWLHNGFINIAFEETSLSAEKREMVDTLRDALKAKDDKAVQAAVTELEANNVYVTIEDGEVSFKGSKSLGNVPRVRDILARGYKGVEVRYLLLKAHYRRPLTFSWKLLDEARSSLQRWETARRRVRQEMANAANVSKSDHNMEQAIAEARAAFAEAMDNDFNTSGALGAAFTFITALNGLLGKEVPPSKAGMADAVKLLDDFEYVLGFQFEDESELGDEETAWLAEREEARNSRDFATSDRLRNRLASRGIAVEDTAQGQRWHRDTPENLVANLLPGKKGEPVEDWMIRLFEAEFRLHPDSPIEHLKAMKALLETLVSAGKAEYIEKDGGRRVRRKKA